MWGGWLGGWRGLTGTVRLDTLPKSPWISVQVFTVGIGSHWLGWNHLKAQTQNDLSECSERRKGGLEEQTRTHPMVGLMLWSKWSWTKRHTMLDFPTPVSWKRKRTQPWRWRPPILTESKQNPGHGSFLPVGGKGDIFLYFIPAFSTMKSYCFHKMKRSMVKISLRNMSHLYTVTNLELACSQYIYFQKFGKFWRGLRHVASHGFARNRIDFVQNFSTLKRCNLFF